MPNTIVQINAQKCIYLLTTNSDYITISEPDPGLGAQGMMQPC